MINKSVVQKNGEIRNEERYIEASQVTRMEALLARADKGKLSLGMSCTIRTQSSETTTQKGTMSGE